MCTDTQTKTHTHKCPYTHKHPYTRQHIHKYTNTEAKNTHRHIKTYLEIQTQKLTGTLTCMHTDTDPHMTTHTDTHTHPTACVRAENLDPPACHGHLGAIPPGL